MGFGGLGQKHLEVVPVGAGVPDQPVVSGHTEVAQPLHQGVRIHPAIRPARFSIVIGQVLIQKSGVRLGEGSQAGGQKKKQRERCFGNHDAWTNSAAGVFTFLFASRRVFQ